MPEQHEPASWGVFSEHVVSEGSTRRYARIVEIRATPGGHRLSHEMLMLLVLALEPEWTLFPSPKN